MYQPEVNTALLVIVGNEILSAKIPDENSPFLLQRLRKLGVRVVGLRVVPDRREVLVQTFRECLGRARWVLSTGGIGPTHDDITIPALAEALDRELVEEPRLTAIIREFYRDQVTEAHLSMAWVPEGARLVESDTQVFPVLEVEGVYVLPGSPGLMRAQFLGIQEAFRGPGFHLRKVFLQLDEGRIADHMERIEAAYPGVELGSYPLWGSPEQDLVVTLEGRDEGLVEAATEALLEVLPEGCLVRVDRGSE